MFPAQAGMNRILDIVDNVFIGVPRAGGDEPESYTDGAICATVFPAQAGMNRTPSRQLSGSHWCSPRRRG